MRGKAKAGLLSFVQMPVIPDNRSKAADLAVEIQQVMKGFFTIIDRTETSVHDFQRMKIEIIMHRYLLVLLAVVAVLSQWGWAEHAYHEHDHDEVCEVCLTANPHDHAVIPSLPPQRGADAFVIGEPTSRQASARQTVCYYTSRAPPRFL